MDLLNVGCGVRYLESWTNIDFIKAGPSVIAHNLLKGLPFPDASFDVVYHSHVLEHLSRASAIDFTKECHRVLKPGGIMRIAVPNLEVIIKEYFKNLNAAIEGDKEAEYNYEWIMLELFDQMTRNKSGGEMGKYWTQTIIPNEKYIAERFGHEFINYRKSLVNTKAKPPSVKKLTLRKRLVKWLIGNKGISEMEVGNFRQGGEIHQWMYDRYSLGKLLRSVGLSDVLVVDAFTSSIPNWQKHLWLDVENGEIRKPDSLFMECKK
jgi:predicted SAM-dependent methyltransferase